MFGLLFDIMGACAHFMWDTLQALANIGFHLLSALLSLLAWPFKTVHGLLSGMIRWTPLFLGACGMLAVLVVALTLLAAYANHRRKIK